MSDDHKGIPRKSRHPMWMKMEWYIKCWGWFCLPPDLVTFSDYSNSIWIPSKLRPRSWSQPPSTGKMWMRLTERLDKMRPKVIVDDGTMILTDTSCTQLLYSAQSKRMLEDRSCYGQHILQLGNLSYITRHQSKTRPKLLHSQISAGIAWIHLKMSKEKNFIVRFDCGCTTWIRLQIRFRSLNYRRIAGSYNNRILFQRTRTIKHHKEQKWSTTLMDNVLQWYSRCARYLKVAESMFQCTVNRKNFHRCQPNKKKKKSRNGSRQPQRKVPNCKNATLSQYTMPAPLPTGLDRQPNNLDKSGKKTKK